MKDGKTPIRVSLVIFPLFSLCLSSPSYPRKFWLNDEKIFLIVDGTPCSSALHALHRSRPRAADVHGRPRLNQMLLGANASSKRHVAVTFDLSADIRHEQYEAYGTREKKRTAGWTDPVIERILKREHPVYGQGFEPTTSSARYAVWRTNRIQRWRASS